MDVRCAAAHSRHNAPPRASEQDKRSVTQVILTRTCSPVKDFGGHVPNPATSNDRSLPEPDEGRAARHRKGWRPTRRERSPRWTITRIQLHRRAKFSDGRTARTVALATRTRREDCAPPTETPQRRLPFRDLAAITELEHVLDTSTAFRGSPSPERPLTGDDTSARLRPTHLVAFPTSCIENPVIPRYVGNYGIVGFTAGRDQPSDLSASDAENMRSGSRPSKYAPISSARPAGVHCASASKRCSTTGAAMSATIGP